MTLLADNPEFGTLEAVSRLLGVQVKKIYEMVERGDCKTCERGGRRKDQRLRRRPQHGRP